MNTNIDCNSYSYFQNEPSSFLEIKCVMGTSERSFFSCSEGVAASSAGVRTHYKNVG